MTTRDDLVSRLKSCAKDCRMLGDSEDAAFFTEAATAIEARGAENARLTEQIERVARVDNSLAKQLSIAMAKNADLERQLAEETERCARVAESNERRFEWPLLALGDERRSPTSLMQSAIAAAIRGGAK